MNSVCGVPTVKGASVIGTATRLLAVPIDQLASGSRSIAARYRRPFVTCHLLPDRVFLHEDLGSP